MSGKKFRQLDPVIHSRTRLAILSILISVKYADFTHLKKTIDATDGNLSVNLTRLEEAGYITIKKSFRGKKSRTTCFVTQKGRKAFSEYVKALESYISFGK